MRAGRRRQAARVAAPAAFLAAATAAVLLVRAAVDRSDAAPATGGRPAAPVVERRVAPRANAAARRFYVIRAGDTLAAVATRFHTSVDQLLSLNPGVRPTSLRIGQRIRTR
jgi:Tfp pilus assembly protein FimV